MTKKFLILWMVLTLALLAIEYFFAPRTAMFRAPVLMWGTLVLASISLLTFGLTHRASGKTNPHQFVRGVMGSTFLKFALCVLAAGVYLFLERKNINKPDLYCLMGLYVVYTILETGLLFSQSKKTTQS